MLERYDRLAFHTYRILVYRPESGRNPLKPVSVQTVLANFPARHPRLVLSITGAMLVLPNIAYLIIAINWTALSQKVVSRPVPTYVENAQPPAGQNYNPDQYDLQNGLNSYLRQFVLGYCARQFKLSPPRLGAVDAALWAYGQRIAPQIDTSYGVQESFFKSDPPGHPIDGMKFPTPQVCFNRGSVTFEPGNPEVSNIIIDNKTVATVIANRWFKPGADSGNWTPAVAQRNIADSQFGRSLNSRQKQAVYTLLTTTPIPTPKDLKASGFTDNQPRFLNVQSLPKNQGISFTLDGQSIQITSEGAIIDAKAMAKIAEAQKKMDDFKKLPPLHKLNFPPALGSLLIIDGILGITAALALIIIAQFLNPSGPDRSRLVNLWLKLKLLLIAFSTIALGFFAIKWIQNDPNALKSLTRPEPLITLAFGSGIALSALVLARFAAKGERTLNPNKTPNSPGSVKSIF